MFDGDAFVKALDPPAIRLGGRDYVGRTLSINEWVPMEPMLRKIQGGEGTLEDAYKIIRRFCDISFRRSWWRRWMWWKPSVSEMIVALPPAAMKEAISDFLLSQARAMGATSIRDEKEVAEAATVSDSPPVT